MNADSANDLWYLDQRSRQVIDFRGGMRGAWDDEASRELTHRYLAPQEEDDVEARKNLHLQVDSLGQAHSKFDLSGDHARDAMRHSADVSEALRLTDGETKTARQYLDSYARFRAEAGAKCASTQKLIEDASCACNQVPGNPVPQKQFERVYQGTTVDFGAMAADSVYVVNGYAFETDAQGRVALASGWLHLAQDEREYDKVQTDIGKLGKGDDEGGHLIGARFGGPTQAFNLVPQNSNLNRSEWKKMENSWAAAVKSGQPVYVLVQPDYGDSPGARPVGFNVSYQIGGADASTYFYNRASR